jgi:hypothetical protein
MSIQGFRITAAAFGILTMALFAADSPFAGTWKLNAAKSKLEGSGVGQSATVQIEVIENALKATVQATDPQGQPLNFSYQAPLDGKPGTVTGSPTTDTVSVRSVNDHTLTAQGKKAGKVVYNDRRVVSKDGKTMTINRNGTDPNGKKFHAVLVFEKQ